MDRKAKSHGGFMVIALGLVALSLTFLITRVPRKRFHRNSAVQGGFVILHLLPQARNKHIVSYQLQVQIN